jgi:hypothetical protein
MDGFMVMADILCKLYLYSCILMVTHYFTYDTIDNKEENYCRDYKAFQIENHKGKEGKGK